MTGERMTGSCPGMRIGKYVEKLHKFPTLLLADGGSVCF